MKVIYQGTSLLQGDKLIEQLLNPGRIIACDIETVSLTNKTIIGFGIAISPTDAFYIPVYPETSEILPLAYLLLTRKDITKYYHNGNFDIIGLRDFAKEHHFPEPDVWNIGDTNIMANVSGLWPDLHTLGNRILNNYDLFTIQELLEKARQETGRKDVTMLDVPLEMVARKCCNDVLTTFRLIEPLQAQLTDQTRECYEVDLKLTSHLKEVEKKGFALDHDYLEQQYNKLIVEAEIYEDWAYELGFNIASPAQVGMYLANQRVVLPLTKSGKQLDTSEEVLERVKHPAAAEILKYRGIRKQLSTYIEPNLHRSRVFTHFRLDLSTGRLASFDDNLQNIPPDLRSMYNPDSGIFTWGDMSQAEMRMFAHFSQDPVMLQAYRDGISIHEVTFRGIYPDLPYDKSSHYYTLAKSFNFAMIFNAEDGTLSSRFKVPFKLARQTKQDWLSLYSVGHDWMQKTLDIDSDYVEGIDGRRMRLPNEFERGRKHRDTCKISYTIQGSVASANKRALLKVLESSHPPDFRLQVHDEFVIDGEYDFPKYLDTIFPGVYIPFEKKSGVKWN